MAHLPADLARTLEADPRIPRGAAHVLSGDLHGKMQVLHEDAS